MTNLEDLPNIDMDLSYTPIVARPRSLTCSWKVVIPPVYLYHCEDGTFLICELCGTKRRLSGRNYCRAVYRCRHCGARG